MLTSRSTSLNLLLVHLPTLPGPGPASRVATPPRLDHPVGLVEAVLIENIKWLYTQTSVISCADASQ